MCHDTGYIDTLRKTRPANSRWKILVLDAYTKVHLNYLMTTYQALEEGVQRKLFVDKMRDPVERRVRGMVE